jgi:hypothetical protein
MTDGVVGQQHQFVPALRQCDEQRQKNCRQTSQWLMTTSRTTAPATARMTNPIAITTSMMTMCFSGPE